MEGIVATADSDFARLCLGMVLTVPSACLRRVPMPASGRVDRTVRSAGASWGSALMAGINGAVRAALGVAGEATEAVLGPHTTGPAPIAP